MPRVPEAEQSVVPAPFPGARLTAAPTAETLGAPIGDTVARAGAYWYDQEVRQANESALFEADTLLANHQTAMETKLQSYQGDTVLGAGPEILAEWKKGVEEISKGLSNGTQRGGFAKREQQRWAQLNSTIQRYTTHKWGEHQDKGTADTLLSSMDRARQSADGSSSMQGAIDLERNRGANAMRAYGERKGLTGIVTESMANDPRFAMGFTSRGEPVPGVGERFSSPQYSKMQETFTSKLHREAITGLLAKELDQRAQQYFEANKHELTAEDMDGVEKLVTEGSLRGESQREAFRLVEESRGMATADQRAQQIEGALQIKNPKLQDATVERLRHLHTMYTELGAQAYSQQFMQGSKNIDELWNAPAYAKKLAGDMMPLSTWLALKPEDQHALQVKLDRLRTPELRTHSMPQWLKFSALTDETLATITPEALNSRFLIHFDAHHYDEAIKQWQAAIVTRDKGKKEAGFLMAIPSRELIWNFAIENKLFKNPKDLSADETVLFHRFQTLAAASLAALPKEATPDQINKVLHDIGDPLLNQQFKARGPLWGFFDKTIRGIEVPDQPYPDSVRIPLKEIPEARQEILKGKLREMNLPVTTQNIEALEARMRLLKKPGPPIKRAVPPTAPQGRP